MFYIKKFLNKISFTALATFSSACFSHEYTQNSIKLIMQKNDVPVVLKSDSSPENLLILEAFNELEKILVYPTGENRIETFGLALYCIAMSACILIEINLIPKFYIGNFLIPVSVIAALNGIASSIVCAILLQRKNYIVLQQIKIINSLLIKKSNTVAEYFPLDLENKIIEILEKITIKNTQHIKQFEILCDLLNQHFMQNRIKLDAYVDYGQFKIPILTDRQHLFLLIDNLTDQITQQTHL
ncbi:hypothetical protein J120_02335 [candidate division TM6 bacterium JCVI TM6SC1]|uniref:Lipoprotein n=1 Tax=candidate division TM6 bacterium JCVI TM6SC1 TaxID=1306947 RepID=A0A0D2K4K9_9BACT|nr:hypothetical protein J120_02335 [candidate division TM6 bacterium JCVI TM6SC1]